MSVYQFLALILGHPMDETMAFNVCDPCFWKNLREQLDNERTREALDHIDAAVENLASIPEEARMMTLEAEFARSFLLPDAPMPPLESSYGIEGESIHDIAADLGVLSSIDRFLPDDHIANEMNMLVPLDQAADPSQAQLETLAGFFESHPMALLDRMLSENDPLDDASGFYRAIVEFAYAWMQWDLDAFEGAQG